MYIANYGLYYSYQYALSYSISLSVLCVRIFRHTAKLNVDAAEYEINFYLFITYSYMSFIVQSLEESSTTIEYILLLLLLIGCYIEFIHCSRSSGIVRTVDGSTMGWNIDRTQSSIHWQNCILLLRMLPWLRDARVLFGEGDGELGGWKQRIACARIDQCILDAYSAALHWQNRKR